MNKNCLNNKIEFNIIYSYNKYTWKSRHCIFIVFITYYFLSFTISRTITVFVILIPTKNTYALLIHNCFVLDNIIHYSLFIIFLSIFSFFFCYLVNELIKHSTTTIVPLNIKLSCNNIYSALYPRCRLYTVHI